MASQTGPPSLRMTHVGGPTVVMELEGWRILTDPTFDPPGRTYGFGLGTSSTKTVGPAMEPDAVGPLDVILLSHDHHADNLDDRGRELLPNASTVVTTESGQRRLGLSNAVGLRSGASLRLTAPGRPDLVVRGTPCRHGPPLSRPISGEVVGFALNIGDNPRVRVWMTGDTVLHRAVRRTANELDVDVLLVHLGSVQFPISGPLRYSMTGNDAIELISRVRPRASVPVHFEGWSHFHEPEAHLRAVLDAAAPDIRGTLRWLTPGEPQQV